MDDETTSLTPRPVRWNVGDVFTAVFMFFRGTAEAAHDAWQMLEMTAASHSAYIMEKQEFAQSAGADIERIATEGE